MEIPFLSGYMTMDAANRGKEAAQFQQAGQFMTLQGAMEDRGAKRAALERENQFRTRLAGATTDEQRAQIAMEVMGPAGVISHLDKVSRDKQTAETARARLMQTAAQFTETKRLRQAEINRLTSNDEKRDAQRILDNEARAFELQLKGEAARLSGAIGADTVMGFQPSPVPQAPTMGVGQPAPQMGAAPMTPEAQAVQQINAGGGAPMSIEIPTASPSVNPGPMVRQPSPAAAVAAPEAFAQVAPVAPAPPNNFDARDLGANARPVVPTAPSAAPTAVVPQPGQGVPGVRAAAAQVPMPNFTGSPREVRKAQNGWMEDMAKAQMKDAAKDGKISLTGGRESVFINRVVNSGNQAAADLENVVKLPISSSRGLFGGRSQGKGLLDASKETLANTMTTQEVQTYNVVATGFQRALAAIEGMGLAPANALMHQMDSVIMKEGDTNQTKLLKIAQIRQIVEKGLETVVANQRVDAETKKLAQGIVEKVQKAVPFTVGEVLALENLQNANPTATMKDVMAAKKQEQGAGGWTDEKERRFQELKRKQGGT